MKPEEVSHDGFWASLGASQGVGRSPKSPIKAEFVMVAAEVWDSGIWTGLGEDGCISRQRARPVWGSSPVSAVLEEGLGELKFLTRILAVFPEKV